MGASSIAPDSLTAEWLPAIDIPAPAADVVYTLHVSEQPGFVPSGVTAKLAQAGDYSGVAHGLRPATRYYLKVAAGVTRLPRRDFRPPSV